MFSRLTALVHRGFRFTATAPVNESLAETLAAEPDAKDASGKPYSVDIVRRALAQENNEIDNARKALKAQGPGWLKEQEEQDKKDQEKLERLRQLGDNADAEEDPNDSRKRGLFRDALGTLQVNLQTAEVRQSVVSLRCGCMLRFRRFTSAIAC